MSYFSFWMNKILDAAEMNDEEADQMLVLATQETMQTRLGQARNRQGRHGWWNAEVCSVEDLYKMRDKAIADKDHSSTLNFTAMIAMRESVEN